MTATLKPLHELVPGFGEEGPQRGDELLAADFGTLTPLQQEVRRHLVLAMKSSQSLSFESPREVGRRLELGHVILAARKWVVMGLDEHRHRVMVPSVSGGMQAQRKPFRYVPWAKDLADMPLPHGGAYLLLYGGGPEFLGIPNSKGVTAGDDIAELRKRVPLVDAMFWQLKPGEPATLYSLALGLGERDGELVEFPDPALAQSIWPRAQTVQPPDSPGEPSAHQDRPGTVNPA